MALYTVSPKVFKGKAVKPHSEQQMLQLIASIYQDKAKADRRVAMLC